VAAGNFNSDASAFSPADVTRANTVGAIDDKNVKAPFSNFGKVLVRIASQHIFYPLQHGAQFYHHR
jgi:subtilisin family serine protease